MTSITNGGQRGPVRAVLVLAAAATELLVSGSASAGRAPYVSEVCSDLGCETLSADRSGGVTRRHHVGRIEVTMSWETDAQCEGPIGRIWWVGPSGERLDRRADVEEGLPTAFHFVFYGPEPGTPGGSPPPFNGGTFTMSVRCVGFDDTVSASIYIRPRHSCISAEPVLYCGGESDRDDHCWCDAACASNGDCCEDKQNFCWP
jgi:hypothetical protein